MGSRLESLFRCNCSPGYGNSPISGPVDLDQPQGTPQLVRPLTRSRLSRFYPPGDRPLTFTLSHAEKDARSCAVRPPRGAGRTVAALEARLAEMTRRQRPRTFIEAPSQGQKQDVLKAHPATPQGARACAGPLASEPGPGDRCRLAGVPEVRAVFPETSQTRTVHERIEFRVRPDVTQVRCSAPLRLLWRAGDRRKPRPAGARFAVRTVRSRPGWSTCITHTPSEWSGGGGEGRFSACPSAKRRISTSWPPRARAAVDAAATIEAVRGGEPRGLFRRDLRPGQGRTWGNGCSQRSPCWHVINPAG